MQNGERFRLTRYAMAIAQREERHVAILVPEGAIIELHKFNGNPIGLELPMHVELQVTYTEPGARDSGGGTVTKPAKLETGIEIRVPPFIKEGEKVKVSTETREFAGRA